MVSLSRRSQESFEWALRHFSDRVAEEEVNAQGADALTMLARIYAAHGDYDTARAILLKAINVLQYPYEKGAIPALVELMKILKKEGRKDEPSLTLSQPSDCGSLQSSMV